MPMRWTRIVIVGLLLTVAACGGDAAETTDGGTDTTAATDAGTDEATTTTAGASTETTAAAGGGGGDVDPPGEIILTVGDETWEFIGSLCAYYNALPGESGSEWNVSWVQDNMQVYLNVDSFGETASLFDIGTSTMLWETQGPVFTFTVNGNDITGEGTFTSESGESVDGSVSATCESWVEG